MSAHGHPAPAQIRSRLDHPVIDGDGHWVEFDPVFAERMRKVGGDLAADGFLAAMKTTTRRAEHVGRRAEAPAHRPAGLLEPPGREHARPRHRDDAAAALRAAAGVRHRLRDHLPDRRPAPAADRRRRHAARGDSRPQHRDRGLLPRPGRPDDAGRDHPDAHAGGGDRRARVRHARARARRSACSAAACRGASRRRRSPIRTPRASPSGTTCSALDSDHDYDPVWAKCQELGIAPTFHSSGSNQGLRMSPSNFVYNHIGHFAAAGHAVSKAIFLGGVTRRFPELRFAFLEGGVGWACQLFGDLIEHWERRSAQGAGADGSAQARPHAADEPGREVRRRRHRGGAAGARRLARPRRRA